MTLVLMGHAKRRPVRGYIFNAWIVAAVLALLSFTAAGDDWPTYRHDNQRSGVSPTTLKLPLTEQWVFQCLQAPRPAWPEPARENPYGRRTRGRPLAPLLTFDRAFHVAASGGLVYFGSSADHKVYCLDASTGKVTWVFFTEGPVRMAPTVHAGSVYAGSDDGRVYCLKADTGKLRWMYRVGPDDSRLPGNGQIISRWPVRSGVVVDGGIAYCAAGLFPGREGVYLAAVDATSGKEIWKERINQVAQGYMLASRSRLFVPAGEAGLVAYDRCHGGQPAAVSGPRGNFALISSGALVSGPSWWGGQLSVVRPENTGARLMTLTANCAVATSTTFYAATDKQLYAVSRLGIDLVRLNRRREELLARSRKMTDTPEAEQLKKAIAEIDAQAARLEEAHATAKTWKQTGKYPYSLILGGGILFAGGDGEVAAFNAADGKRVWTGKVTGKAYGLASAGGRLLVSTDKGSIHCFGSGTGRGVIKAATAKAYPRDALAEVYAKAAKRIFRDTPFDKGYALVLGCRKGRLACEIAKRTSLTVIGVESDAAMVDSARRAIDRAGLYGRVVVHHGALDVVPYTKYMFNLIVSDETLVSRRLPPSAAEAYRVLRPCGGVLCIGQPGVRRPGALTRAKLAGWLRSGRIGEGKVVDAADDLVAFVRRGKLPGSGEWSHQYANAANTTCSEDRAIRRPLQMQWYGRPGPRHMFDRHSFAAGPVSVNGRLFTPGDRVLFGQDAYNGTMLWTAELPKLAPRVNIPRDSGFLAATDTHVFIAVGDTCLCLTADSGRRLQPYSLPPDADKEHKYDWGYVAVHEGLLFGSGVRKGNFYRHGRGPWYDRDKRKVNSDFLFAVGQKDRKLRWTYEGVIINSTITIGGGRVYFLEQRDDHWVKSPSRLLDEWRGLAIVALDEKTGKKVWEKMPGNYGKLSPIFFFCYKDEILTVARMSNVYEIWAYNAVNGKQLWFRNHRATHYHHGGHRRKTVILGDTLLQEPVAYDLRTGKRKWTFPKRNKCAALSASANYLFGRAGVHSMFDVGVLAGSRQGQAVEPLTSVTRPGCWINTITAGGLVLTPEASSGCSCGYPIRASMAFVSK